MAHGWIDPRPHGNFGELRSERGFDEARHLGSAQGELPMKSFRKAITLHTRQKYAYVNVTRDVQKAIDESGVKEGLCLVNSMHITSSVFINDDEAGLHQDFAKWL